MFQELAQKIYDSSNLMMPKKSLAGNSVSNSGKLAPAQDRNESIRLKPAPGAQAPAPIEKDKGCC